MPPGTLGARFLGSGVVVQHVRPQGRLHTVTSTASLGVNPIIKQPDQGLFSRANVSSSLASASTPPHPLPHSHNHAGPAETVGLQPGDVILKVNDQPVRNGKSYDAQTMLTFCSSWHVPFTPALLPPPLHSLHPVA